MKREKDGPAARRQAIRAQIDDNLARAYRAILDEELPERFQKLLDQLQQAAPSNATPPDEDSNK